MLHNLLLSLTIGVITTIYLAPSDSFLQNPPSTAGSTPAATFTSVGSVMPTTTTSTPASTLTSTVGTKPITTVTSPAAALTSVVTTARSHGRSTSMVTTPVSHCPCNVSTIESDIRQLKSAVDENQGLNDTVYRLQQEVIRLQNVTSYLQRRVYMPRELDPASPRVIPGSNSTRDCVDVYAGNQTQPGVYSITPSGTQQSVKTYCDGGWTYIMRRNDSSLNFDRYWDEYSMGFGDPADGFWLGLEHVYQLVNKSDYTLRMEMVGWTGKRYWAQYGVFGVGDEVDGYPLLVGNYTGNYADGLGPANGLRFTTRDRDHDEDLYSNCASVYGGAWWSTDCGMSLTRPLIQHSTTCAEWYNRCVKTVEMKVIPTPSIA